uniref:Uncharacterized protein n=1 Tax=Oryza glaberrima TaxID=4538 RepID=A0A679BE60_ORYGL|nr:hypothetical protein [Oryza glaberrima]
MRSAGDGDTNRGDGGAVGGGALMAHGGGGCGATCAHGKRRRFRLWADLGRLDLAGPAAREGGGIRM